MPTPTFAVAIRAMAPVALAVLAACSSPPLSQPELSIKAHAISGSGMAFLTAAQKANLCVSESPADHGLTDSTHNYVTAAGIFDWCVPEYHDDQRFSDGNSSGELYGPVAHTFAVPELATYVDHNQFDNNYVLVAIVDLDEVDLSLKPYTDLKLTTLHSCMYLKHHDFLTRGWFTAVMMPGTGTSCPVNPAETASNQLEVDIEKYSDHEIDYPPVTRFVEGNDKRTYVGVMCTDRWCVVGPKNFPGTPSAHASAGMPSTREYKVKGWFDDQVLGVLDGGATHGIKRRVRASMIPDAGLGNIALGQYLNTFRTVATVYFPEEPPADSKYKTRYNFHQGSNLIEMKSETDATFPGGLKWTARINGTVTNFKVARMDHSAWVNSVTPTARFRWKDTDEDFWVACAVGCCLVNGDTY